MRKRQGRARTKGTTRRRWGAPRFLVAARFLVATGGLGVAPVTHAAGWDTPIVHTARHQAMGGTAIASVDDPSASFHNPAGYVGVDGLELMGSMSLLLGKLKSSPGNYAEATGVQSDLVVAPFPLLAAGYRAHDWVTLGLAAYPVASGAASYSYPASTGGTFEDSLRAVYIEVSPGASLNVPEKYVPGRLSIGVGYRATAVTFDRYKGTDEATQFDLSLSGWNFTGFRVGAQYSPFLGREGHELRLGFVLRNRIQVTGRADEGTTILPASDIELDFILPLKLGAGVRYDIARFGVALDYEFAAQSQNDTVEISGVLEGTDERSSLTNYFMWQNGHTGRVGVEYRAPYREFTFPVRAGYVYDSKVGNPDYPTAFGTPPTATHSVTAGVGLHRARWQVNAAAAYRTGSTTVESVEPGCAFCAYPGEYSMSLVGAYLDASIDLDL